MADKVIFWDFDGTLGQRPGGWSGTLAEILAAWEPQCGITREDIRQQMHGGYPWSTPETPHLHLRDPDAWWRALEPTIARALVALGIAGQRAQELARLVRPYYLRASAWALFADTLPALRQLARLGWRQMLLSNHVPELPAIVAYLGLGPYLEGIVNSAEVGYEKPHPGIYHYARRLAGEAEVLWMVGDNYHADVLGARAAGFEAILVRRSHPEATLFCPDLMTAMRHLVSS